MDKPVTNRDIYDMLEKDFRKGMKQRAQVKSRWYYIFWGTATVSVVLGQLYVGSGYRMYAEALLKIFNSVEVELGTEKDGVRYY